MVHLYGCIKNSLCFLNSFFTDSCTYTYITLYSNTSLIITHMARNAWVYNQLIMGVECIFSLLRKQIQKAKAWK